MLDALGYKDMVKNGPTKATLTGSWPGSPGAFGLATLRGTLHADVGEGQLLDVEPGRLRADPGPDQPGRIPRRLSLDFSRRMHSPKRHVVADGSVQDSVTASDDGAESSNWSRRTGSKPTMTCDDLTEQITERWSFMAAMLFGHLPAGFRVGTDVPLFERDLIGLQEHPHQLAGEAAGLREKNRKRAVHDAPSTRSRT